MSWDDVPGATSYSLSWRRPGGGFQPGDAVIATDTEATLAVPDHGLWRVRLQACNDAGCGPGRAREVALVQEPIVTGASDPATGSTLTLTGACTDVTVTVLAFEAAYTSMFLRFDMSDMSMATDLMSHEPPSRLDDGTQGPFGGGARARDPRAGDRGRVQDGARIAQPRRPHTRADLGLDRLL